MENYNEFLNRINSFEKSELILGSGNFIPNTSVLKKIDADNHFCKFYGDTVVFDLDYNIKKKTSDIVNEFYKNAHECFCERLVSNTFHMTLHDLSNSPILNDISAEVFGNEVKLIEMLKSKPVQNLTIRMKTNYIFNMVNTSLVLGLYPADETEYKKLMNLYQFVDGIKCLPYPLTPHITLAYYNRKGFSQDSIRKLEKIVNELNKSGFEIELSADKLVYQKFTSMNNYISVFGLVRNQ